MADAANKRYLLAAAIDFGTAYSGYALSFRHEYELDPKQVSVEMWAGGPLTSLKTSTCVLFDKKKKFHSFGFEAEDYYSRLAEEGEHHDWYFFRRFKMRLFDKKTLDGKFTVDDEMGKSMPSIYVVSACIRYLSTHLIDKVENRIGDGYGIHDDIRWVLTVPASWNEASKQFMREAAKNAGLDKDSLIILPEPEAILLYCKVTQNERSSQRQRPLYSTGTKYMLVDIGNTATKINAYEVMENRTLRELMYTRAERCGSDMINAAWGDFLDEIFGIEEMRQFKTEDTESWSEMLLAFESKKRIFDDKKDTTVRLPARLVDIFRQRPASKKYAGKKTVRGGKLITDAALMRSWFDELCKRLVGVIRKVLLKTELSPMETIFLVGVISESVLPDIASNFQDKHATAINDSEVAALVGGVIFGHDPVAVSTPEVYKETYGIRVFKAFDSKKHPLSKRVVVGGIARCKDLFYVHIRKGDMVQSGEPQRSLKYMSLEDDQESLFLDIFASSKENPMFTDEPGSTHLGQVEFELPGQEMQQIVLVHMTYNAGKLIVTANVEGTARSTSKEFDVFA